jgi:hypothetical protein
MWYFLEDFRVRLEPWGEVDAGGAGRLSESFGRSFQSIEQQ